MSAIPRVELKERVLEELRSQAKQLGHSPQWREIPLLSMKCRNYFGSFNKAKLKIGLSVKNLKINEFPENAFKLDDDLATIISYITFDGHLYRTFRGLYYSSKNPAELIEFEKIMVRKFGLVPKYHFNNSGSRGQTHVIYFFNKKVCQFLFQSGLPKGNKAAQAFDVPNWIKDSKELSRAYLKIAYLCEGSFKEEKGRTPRITFTQAKCTDVLNSGISFMNQIKSMLSQFGIDSGDISISGERIRKKDNKPSKDLRFRIKVEDNNKFIREIGWLK